VPPEKRTDPSRKSVALNSELCNRTAADAFLAPGLFGALPDPPKQKYDPAAARALLAASGHADDITLTLTATKDRYIDDAQVAEAIGQYLTRIGMHVTIDALPQTVFFPQRAKRLHSLAMGGWGFSEASDLFRTFVVSTLPDRGVGGSNYGGYHNEAFDSLLLAALQDMDENRRRSELEDATRIALNDNALIPLYWETTIWAYKERFAYVGRADQMTDPDGLTLKGK
jgi:peptide/nickel transport system substrate-binding protein